MQCCSSRDRFHGLLLLLLPPAQSRWESLDLLLFSICYRGPLSLCSCLRACSQSAQGLSFGSVEKSPLLFSFDFSPMLELSQPRGGQCSSFWGCRGVGLVVWLRGALVLTPSLRPPQCWHAVAHLNASSYSRCDSENKTPCYQGRKKRERERRREEEEELIAERRISEQSAFGLFPSL